MLNPQNLLTFLHVKKKKKKDQRTTATTCSKNSDKGRRQSNSDTPAWQNGTIYLSQPDAAQALHVASLIQTSALAPISSQLIFNWNTLTKPSHDATVEFFTCILKAEGKKLRLQFRHHQSLCYTQKYAWTVDLTWWVSTPRLLDTVFTCPHTCGEGQRRNEAQKLTRNSKEVQFAHLKLQ